MAEPQGNYVNTVTETDYVPYVFFSMWNVGVPRPKCQWWK